MTVEVGDRFRITATFQYGDLTKFQNVWWVRVGGSGVAGDSDFVAAAKDSMITLYQNVDQLMSINITTDTILIDRVDWVTDRWEVIETMYMGTWPTGLTFAAADSLLPRNAAAMQILYPAIRRHQGRKYYGGFTEAVNASGGALESTLVTALAGLAADLLVSYTIFNSSNLFDFVIPNMSGNATNLPTSILTDSTWHSQRRRLHGVGI